MTATRDYFVIREGSVFGPILWEGWALREDDAWEAFRTRNNMSYTDLYYRKPKCHINGSGTPLPLKGV